MILRSILLKIKIIKNIFTIKSLFFSFIKILIKNPHVDQMVKKYPIIFIFEIIILFNIINQ